MSPDCDVLICGLGPVGQLLALLLGRFGVDVIALDEAPEPYNLPRAAVVDDEVMRIFQAAGVDQQILADAQVQRAVSFVTRRGRAIQVFRTEHGELGHPPLASIHQPTMERAMVSALAEHDTIDARWGQRMESVEPGGDGVTALIRDDADGGDARPTRARYLVACDGGRSGVRDGLGIAFGGSTFAQRWLVVDALVDRPLAKVPHPHFIGDIDRPIVSLPMSPGRHRWEWMLHPGEDQAPFLVPARINELLAPWIYDEKVEVERAVVYTFHAREAERWRAGRVLLAGDAAHVMPPFVGQGFSSGARDAGNLAWKLDAVLRGAPERLLDTYETERRPHVRKMQRLAVRWGGVVQTRKPAVGAVRDGAIELLERSRLLGHISDRAKPLPTYGGGAFADRPDRRPWRRGVGSLFPQPDRLDDGLGSGWSVVCATGDAAARWAAEGMRVETRPGDAWLQRYGAEWALLRPDRFVFACEDMPHALSALREMVGSGMRTERSSTQLLEQKAS